VDKEVPKSPSSKGLSSFRNDIEEEGAESGRDAREQYRDQLKAMKKTMAELRAMRPLDEVPAENQTWYERIGEQLGDFLAEPSAGLILIATLVILFIVGLVVAVAVG
jgi:hypothetical protein